MTNQEIFSLPGIGDLLNRTWQIYKERFWVFLGIMILPVIIIAFLGIILFIFSSLIKGIALFPLGSAVIFIFGLITILWREVSLLYAIKDREEKIGIRESFIRGWPKIISYFWISLLAGFITLGGYLFLIIPGIIFSIWFVFSVYILVSEDLKGMNALFKSKQLVEGYWWKVFWRFLIMLIVALVAFFFTSLVFGILSFLMKTPWIGNIGSALIFLLLPPFATTYAFLIYKDLRKIKAGIVFEPPKRGTKVKFILLGIIGFLLIPAILTSIVLVSLGQARERAKEARVISNMFQIRAEAEMISLPTGNYSGVSCDHPNLTPLCQNIKAQIGIEPTIYSSQNAYCAYIKLPKGDYYCIDSSNRAGRTFLFPGQSGYCDGITFICPVVYPLIPLPEGD